MTDLIGSFGLLLVVSAAIFGPLSGWLAGRRDRNPVIWLALGSLLGPIALLLLYAAPPGRCTMCDTPVRGWSSICPVCGAPLTIAAGARRYQERGIPPARAPEPAVGTRPRPLPAASAGSVRTMPLVTRLASEKPEGPPPANVVEPPIRLPVERSASARTRRPQFASTPPATVSIAPYDADESVSEVLATAVYFGGTAGLAVGGRYVVTREGSTFRLLGPVDLDPKRVALERPLNRLTSTAVGERLVITEANGSNVSLAIGLGAIAGMSGPDLEVALASPEPSVIDRPAG